MLKIAKLHDFKKLMAISGNCLIPEFLDAIWRLVDIDKAGKKMVLRGCSQIAGMVRYRRPY